MEVSTVMPKRVAVIGAGVNGLTVANHLLIQNYHVKIIAEKIGVETTSIVAGALWELPHAVCGHTEASEDDMLHKLEEWAIESYEVFSALHLIPASGVHFRRVHFYSELPLKDDPSNQRKIDLLKTFVKGLEVIENPIPANPDGHQFKFQYSYLTPVVNMEVYLPWLVDEFKEKGGEILSQRISQEEFNSISEFKERHEVDIVINCSGLGAGELVADKDVFPVRGAWYSFLNDGSSFEKVTEAHCTSLASQNKNENFIFIVPRGENKLVIGGIANPNVSDLDMLPDAPILQQMLDDSRELLPALRHLKIDDRAELRVGLRPFRRGSVRLEIDAEGILHNYGHGGSGVLLSWGCAHDVYNLLKELPHSHSLPPSS